MTFISPLENMTKDLGDHVAHLNCLCGSLLSYLFGQTQFFIPMRPSLMVSWRPSNYQTLVPRLQYLYISPVSLSFNVFLAGPRISTSTSSCYCGTTMSREYTIDEVLVTGHQDLTLQTRGK